LFVRFANGLLYNVPRPEVEGMDSVSFEIRHRHDGAAEVRLGGELDLCTGPDVASRLRRLLQTSPVETVVLDLGGLSYCDCTGLNVFANAQRDAELLGKSIVLTRPRGLLRRVFDSVQFGRVVRIADEANQFDDREGSSDADVAEP
jgi:anti-sigma B factor antagonist